MPTRLNKVISASRRTELLAHYPDLLAARLEEIGPERIHTLVLWSKDPTNLLRHPRLCALLPHVGQVFLHWTVTGLGGTFVEPNVPTPESQLALLDEVIAAVGDPRRVHWRYDPLLAAQRGPERVTNLDLPRFRALATRFAQAGVPVVHTSFVTIYAKVRRRLGTRGISFEEIDAAAQQAALQGLSAAAAEHGLGLVTCAQPGFPMQRCIDGDLLTALHPTQEPCRTDRAAGQRALCGCTASLDIGRYLPCPNQCLYCYAHPAGEGKGV
jgi:DNA repair photolyase